MFFSMPATCSKFISFGWGLLILILILCRLYLNHRCHSFSLRADKPFCCEWFFTLVRSLWCCLLASRYIYSELLHSCISHFGSCLYVHHIMSWMCCQSIQCIIHPCCRHVLSPWNDELGMVFSNSGLLDMLLSQDLVKKVAIVCSTFCVVFLVNILLLWIDILILNSN